MWAIILTLIYSIVYLSVGLSTWAASNYGELPTYALSFDDAENDHLYLSMIFFVVTALVDGFIFAYFLGRMKEIKREFSMQAELEWFAGFWLVLTDLALFVVVQGVSSEWFDSIIYYRVMFYLYTLRSVAIAVVATA